MSAAIARVLATMPVFKPGTVWLAGAGPGDARHLTLMTLSALNQADVVVHDALIDPAVLGLARPGAMLIAAGKRGGKPSAAQADITARLIDLARDGHRVLRLKGGDPFIFGRGGEEVLVLAAHGVHFRIIPGLSSGLTAATGSLIPLTMRGLNQAVILATGHGADRADGLDWAALARLSQPIVLYMAITNLAVIADALLAGGMAGDTPAAVIGSATLADERVLTTTLAALSNVVRQAGLEAPAIVVIGAIVNTRTQLLDLLPTLVDHP